MSVKGESLKMLSPLFHFLYIDFSILFNPSIFAISHAANMGIPYGLIKYASTIILIPSEVSLKIKIVPSAIINTTKDNIDSTAVENRQTKSKNNISTVSINVIGNNNILISTRIMNPPYMLIHCILKIYQIKRALSIIWILIINKFNESPVVYLSV
jgi:hypothetical protein